MLSIRALDATGLSKKIFAVGVGSEGLARAIHDRLSLVRPTAGLERSFKNENPTAATAYYAVLVGVIMRS